MKKKIMLLLVLTLFLGFVFANGAKESSVASMEVQPNELQWWDHYLPLAPMHQIIWDEYQAKTGISVTYTQYDPAKQNEALLLAFRSGKCPDVFSMTFGGNPETSMYKDGWFSPLAVDIDKLPQHIQESLFEGYTLFDGKVYSFPVMNNLNASNPMWYHKSLMDEQKIPQSFSEFRDYAKMVSKESNGKVAGVVLPIAFTTRMNDTILDWLMACGSPGAVDFKNGEYQYASKEMFEVFEFLTGLKDDGSIHPSSVGLDMRQARERWAAGEAAVLFDGSWNIGVIKNNFPAILDDVGVAEPVRYDASLAYQISRNPPKGTFFISGQSKSVKAATDVLLQFTSDDYYVKLANRMDQPPLKLEAVEKANVHSSYKKVIEIFAQTMGYNPDPLIKNPSIGEVYAEMKDLHPNPAEILQGYYSGAITDWKAELIKYNDAMTKERLRAIKKVQSKGIEVSVQDWVFPNWEYGMNYTTDKY